MYTTYHIFPVIPIKYLINEDSNPTTPFKLVTGTKTSILYLCVLFLPYVVLTSNRCCNGIIQIIATITERLIARSPIRDSIPHGTN